MSYFEYAICFLLRLWYNKSHFFIPCPRPAWPGASWKPHMKWKRKGLEKQGAPPSGSNLHRFGASPLSETPGDWSGQVVAESIMEKSPMPCFKAVGGLWGMTDTQAKKKKALRMRLNSTLICIWFAQFYCGNRKTWENGLKIIFINRHWD